MTLMGECDIHSVQRTGSCRALAETYIPDRIKDGYGIHEQLIDRRAVKDGIDVRSSPVIMELRQRKKSIWLKRRE